MKIKNEKILKLLITFGLIIATIAIGMIIKSANLYETRSDRKEQEKLQLEQEEKEYKDQQANKEKEFENAKKDIKSYVAYLDNKNITYDESTDCVIVKGKFSESLSSAFKGTNAGTIKKRLQQTRYNYTRDLEQFKEVKDQPETYMVQCYTDTVDKYGNKGNDIVMSFKIKGSELVKINFDNVYTIEDLGEETFTDLYYSAYK